MTACALRELLVSQLADPAPGDACGVFRERAAALAGTISPALVWLRDHKGVPLHIETIRLAFELSWIWKLAIEKIVLLRDPETGADGQIDVGGEIPEAIVAPLRSYLGELPGLDPAAPLEQQHSREPAIHHGYARFYFTATFSQLAVTLGHIFRVANGDIDMGDVLRDRRILVVKLPALDVSDATLRALGRLVVVSLQQALRDDTGWPPSPAVH